MHQFPNIDKVSRAETLRHYTNHEKSNRRGKSVRTTLKACNRLERHIGKEYAKDQQKIHRHGFNPYFDETPEESQKAIQRALFEEENDRMMDELYELYQRQREYDECIDMMHLYGLGGMDK